MDVIFSALFNSLLLYMNTYFLVNSSTLHNTMLSMSTCCQRNKDALSHREYCLYGITVL